MHSDLRRLLLVLALALVPTFAFSATSAKTNKETSRDPLADIFKEIQDPAARMRNERQTPLHIAAEDGETNEVTRLLKEGALMDAQDRWKRTPLHLAAESGHVGIVKELLAAGANPNAVTKPGETPLFFALRFWQGDDDPATGRARWSAMVNALLDTGATIKVTSSDGLTPLHLAADAKNGTPDFVELFIKKAQPSTLPRKAGTLRFISPPTAARPKTQKFSSPRAPM